VAISHACGDSSRFDVQLESAISEARARWSMPCYDAAPIDSVFVDRDRWCVAIESLRTGYEPAVRSTRAMMSSLNNLKLVCAQVMTTATGLSYTAQTCTSDRGRR
jgi:hypothetical protein